MPSVEFEDLRWGVRCIRKLTNLSKANQQGCWGNLLIGCFVLGCQRSINIMLIQGERQTWERKREN